MRKTMGRYIDGLDDAGRVALLTAPRMNNGMYWWHPEARGCLVGTVHSGGSAVIPEAILMEADVLLRTAGERSGRYTVHVVPWHEAPAAIRYPKAVRRFGLDRVVRAVKARAAAPDRAARIAAHARISIPVAPLETAGALR